MSVDRGPGCGGMIATLVVMFLIFLCAVYGHFHFGWFPTVPTR